MPVRRDPIERFWEKVDRSGDCWLWTASQNAYGYGQFAVQHNVHEPAHRFAYKLEIGPVPASLELDHLCRVRHCVNPGHLEPVTRQVNTLRGVSFAAAKAKQTACIHGHDFTPANTFTRGKRGGRGCLACRRMTDRKRRSVCTG